MAAQNNNDRLDNLIFDAINTEKPQFDAEKWKAKYPDEYQALISRRKNAASTGKREIRKLSFGRLITRLAAAAAVILVAGLLLNINRQNPDTPAEKPVNFAQSTTKIISMASMRITYQHGGMDALDKQLGDTLDVFGALSSNVSIQELL